MRLVLWPQLGRWWGWRLLGYPPSGRRNRVGPLPGTSRSYPRSGYRCKDRLAGLTLGAGAGALPHSQGSQVMVASARIQSKLQFFPLLPPAPSTWSPFGPAPLLAGPVLGRACPHPGFWHPWKRPTADLPTHSCFSAFTFICTVAVTHRWLQLCSHTHQQH